MAHFQEPSAHCVESVRAESVALSEGHCLALTMTGAHYYDGKQTAKFNIFLPPVLADYATALAAAINAVSVPVTEEA